MKKIIILVVIIFIGISGYGLYKIQKQKNWMNDQLHDENPEIHFENTQESVSSERCKGWFVEGKEEFRFGCDPLYDPS